MSPFCTVPGFELSALLERPEWEFDWEKIRTYFSTKRVVITGAGGSIGRAVTERVHSFAPAFLGLIDHSENLAFHLEQDFASARVAAMDVCDSYDLLSEWKPDLIIHAAAYKHVGLMERTPGSAFLNNTVKTIKLAQQARKLGVSRFLFVSTDKSVYPTCVMGKSKKLAESWLLTHAPEFATVCRFGNVLGSSGSLVEIAFNNILRGEPVKITDPRMMRYFITPKEAVGLLLTSLLFEAPGPFSIRMGAPVSIPDLIRRLGGLLGRAPEIVYTSPGTGEKLIEDLQILEDQLSPTSHPGIVSFSRGKS